jgi:hypothetical protein
MSHTIRCSLKFDARDIWVGVYWAWLGGTSPQVPQMLIYVCILPMLPIRIEIGKGRNDGA